MGEILPIPRIGDVFEDLRGGDRTMRISAHRDRGGDPTTVVVSLWHGSLCRGSFRVAPGDLDRLVSALGGVRAALSPAASAAHSPAAPPPTTRPAGGRRWIPRWFRFGRPAALAEPGIAPSEAAASEAAASGTAEPPAPTPHAA